MSNTLREFLKLSQPLHSVSVVAKQAPLALSNAKVLCRHGLWLVARVNEMSMWKMTSFFHILILFFLLLVFIGFSKDGMKIQFLSGIADHLVNLRLCFSFHIDMRRHLVLSLLYLI